MSIKQLAILVLACSPLLLTACSTTTMTQLENQPLPAKLDGGPYTQAEVQEAILRACNRSGWSAQVQGEGNISASIVVRANTAKVDIRYTPTTVSILYVDSQGLKYGDGRIHRNYNRWVTNLYHNIQRELGSRGQKF